MRILLAAATAFEVKNLAERLPTSVQPVITGVGLVSTAYHLQKAITAYIPDLVLQAGIAGCFDPAYPLGSVVAVSEEVIADLGVEEHGRFRDLADLGLQDRDQFPYTSGLLPNPHIDGLNVPGLPKARSISVSEITTRPDRIRWYGERYAPLVESMEGAALHYVCLQEKVPFLQVRALSNYIGERDKSRWQIGLSLDRLQEAVTIIIDTLNGQL
jgi:futalosine hydrolase